MNRFEHPFEAQKKSNLFFIPKDILLESRVCDLNISLEDTGYKKFSKKLFQEMKSAGINHLKIDFYLADEWFCPADSTLIAIPFWLANSSLKSLEKKFMGKIEGSSPAEFMKLMRHELGHCIEHAYKLSRRKDWIDVFGSPKKKYNPDHYFWKLHSTDFVQHLPDGYAQSHPEEDFAETFAVWLDPNSAWQDRYKSWPGALKKLNFINRLIPKITCQKPKISASSKISAACRIRLTLRKYYARRINQIAKNAHSTDLKHLSH